MELENTTKMSILVGLAGFLAEIVFRETLTGSVLGVVLSVVLAVIILCCSYFAVDGLEKSFSAVHKKDENRRREYDEKLFRLLNKKLSDQVKLEKGIYSLLARGTKMDLPVDDTGAPEDYWRELAESIDNSSLKAAKLVVKYNQKSQEESGRILGQNSEEMLQELRSMSNHLQTLNGEIQELASRAVSMAEERRVSDEAADFAEAPSVEPEPVETAAEPGKSIDELLQAAGEEFFQSPEPEAGPLLDQEAEPEADSMSGLESEPEADSLSGLDLQSGSDAETVPEADPLSGLDFQSESEVLSDVETVPEESDSLSGMETVPEADPLSGLDLKPESDALSIAEIASEEPDQMPETDSLAGLEDMPEALPQPEAGEAEAVTEKEPEVEELLLQEEISPAQSAVMQGMEDVDVNRMMEELFNESLAEEPKEEPESQTITENAESDIQESDEGMLSETGMSEAENVLESALKDAEDLSEEDLDSLLSGLLPEPEPLKEEASEEPETSGGMTALDMLLSQQKAEPKKQKTVAETGIDAEPAPSVEPAAADSGEKAPDAGIVAPEAEKEAGEAVDPVSGAEPTEKTESDTAADSGKAMTPDDIAALLASIDS